MKEINNLFQALSDPTRRQIIGLLKIKDMTPTEILEKIDVSQPTLSHHLDNLKRANLIDGKKEGQFIRYTLNMSVFQMAIDYLIQFNNKKKR